MLGKRLLTAAIGGPLVVAVAILGEPWLSLLVGLAVVIGLVELGSLLRQAEMARRTWPLIGGGMVVAAAILATLAPMSVLGDGLAPVAMPVVLAGAVMALGATVLDVDDLRQATVEWGSAVLGSLYVGLLLPMIAVLGHLTLIDGGSTTTLGPWTIASGTGWLFLLLAVVWSFDSAAYLGGRTWGRRRLAPRISPGKTIEGVVAGGLAAAVAGGLVGMAWLGLPIWLGLILGAAVGLVGQAGDLMESLIKRAAGAKDSGALFPGHGGLLDRVDSLLFSAPLIVAGALIAGATIVPG